MSSGDQRPTYAQATWLFLRLLGIVYLFAFWSAGTQILGLVGHEGILPADQFMRALAGIKGLDRFWIFPTLTWISASDAALRMLCVGGMVLSSLLIAGIVPVVALAAALAFLSLALCRRSGLSLLSMGRTSPRNRISRNLSRAADAGASNHANSLIRLALWCGSSCGCCFG